MENELVSALITQFPELEGKVTVSKPMRVSVDWLPQDLFLKVIYWLHDEQKLTKGHNVIGTDEGENLGFIYMISGPDQVIVILRTTAPKSDPRVPSLSGLYKSFVLFERELCDLFGAQVTGLPSGPRYPLPDNWPKEQWPLRKEWKPENFDRQTMTYHEPAQPAATTADPQQAAVEAKTEALLETVELGEEAKTATAYVNQPLPDAAAAKPPAPAHPEGDNLITVPIGPQHPSLDEPSTFTITLEGEKVEGAVIGIGYNHRGLEKACESRTYVQDLYIIERVCGICSHAHTTAYCMCVEQLAGVTVPPRAEYIRLIVGEMERLHSHLLWLGVAGHEIGFDTLFMMSWRDRERVLDILTVLGGNRINYGINCLGGVRRDIDPGLAQDILKTMDFLETEIEYYLKLAETDSTLAARLAGVGVLSKADCLLYGAAGPVARAAGIADDVRQIEPYGAYRDIPVRVVTDDHADVFGRTLVRIKEMLESIRLIREALRLLPEGPLTVRVPRRIPAGEAIIRVEAPRGEDLHYLRATGTDMPDRVRVRAPTECNWHGMQHMLEGGYLSDVPITIAAIDPCYSCTDRAISLTGHSSLSGEVLDWKQLREYSLQWYRQRGVDPSRIDVSDAAARAD
ncbi:MAG: NADH-quinone oxidoreductase subunit C [Oscillospiraceae bacterium]|nr:NADH-quinone oxidoreductase subunit C [Oscillospiraceae bacterium]MDD4368183.1 NADH-quinone oxidoreductase subunit C [Oscillospiraceae bacterium]